MKLLRKSLVIAMLGALALGGGAWAQAPATDAAPYTPTEGQAGKDVIWLPTAQVLVGMMLDMAELKPDDRLVDLGSGDGRTVIAAAKRGIVARGIEYNPDLVALATRAAAAEGVAHLASFEQGDIFESDFSEATVVTLFLLPSLNLRLRPILLEMPPGTRVISNTFNMEEWMPDETAEVGAGCQSWCTAHKWVVPAKVAGRWRMGDQELVLEQTFQMLQGTLREGRANAALREGRLDGTRIQFWVGDRHYVGEVAADSMRGMINGKTPWTATR